ncbi:YgjP-like metallopeptidase domain-containing protein [Ramlibacter sp.]|uniref:M48 family metallopeptidase n=1 Tax=Ramlibacter sp. TaxID=1917967 RepID=UPI00261A6EE7|nr:YgjP-like metallopeptidase domain-containing protein [Ramlibacter sp.]MDB5953510.1 family peptidase [Ramlibacter sp.]
MNLKYLAHYPEPVQQQVRELLEQQRVGELLLKKYPKAHAIRSERALYDYVVDLKGEFLRSSEPLSKVAWDNALHVIRNALGTHTTVSRVQGGRLKAKREIRVSTLFREAPEDFLRMIVVHELAHFRVREHDKAFYALCTRMEPQYHQLEFDVRLYLTHLDAHGALAWG